MEIKMKAWKIIWTDKSGAKQLRYRNSKHSALQRQVRIRKEGGTSSIENIEIPTTKFELVDFLNGEMNSLKMEEVKWTKTKLKQSKNFAMQSTDHSLTSL